MMTIHILIYWGHNSRWIVHYLSWWVRCTYCWSWLIGRLFSTSQRWFHSQICSLQRRNLLWDQWHTIYLQTLQQWKKLQSRKANLNKTWPSTTECYTWNYKPARGSLLVEDLHLMLACDSWEAWQFNFLNLRGM